MFATVWSIVWQARSYLSKVCQGAKFNEGEEENRLIEVCFQKVGQDPGGRKIER